MKKIVSLLAISIVLCSCYHKYIPTFFDGDKLYSSKDSLTPEHQKNIQKVFTYHNVPYKFENGKILYKGFIDREIIWNYTSKANDVEWIRVNGKYDKNQ